jgi:hypothetical protein
VTARRPSGSFSKRYVIEGIEYFTTWWVTVSTSITFSLARRVFTVETKTHNKPNGNPQIVFDGETIRIDGFEPNRDPVVQAKAQASWLRELLVDSTGREFGVRSVIVFPGWFVNYTGPKERTVWVLNPKALPTFLGHEPQRLSENDIHLASFHLSRFVRAAAH